MSVGLLKTCLKIPFIVGYGFRLGVEKIYIKRKRVESGLEKERGLTLFGGLVYKEVLDKAAEDELPCTHFGN